VIPFAARAAFALLSVVPAFAAGAASNPSPEDKLWQKRLIVLLGDRDIPEVQKQASILEKGRPALKERDVEILGEQRPAGLLHKRFGQGAGFLFILLGKDGEEKLRSKKVVSLDKITQLIDGMPMRKDEVERAQENPSKPKSSAAN